MYCFKKEVLEKVMPAYIFTLAVKVIATTIREGESIKVINIVNKEIKISLLANDATIFPMTQSILKMF